MSWTIAGAEPIERQKELLARYRFASGAERRGSAACCASTWPSGSRTSRRREDHRPVGADRAGPGRAAAALDRLRGPRRTAPLIAQIFGCEVSDLPDGQGWASETVTLITHAGTHVDAPWHYFPTSGGERARTIDELPLDWFVRPGVRLDVREVERGERIEVAHLEAALGGTSCALDIVLLWTGAEEAWDTPEYFNAGSGLTRDVDDLAARARREGDRHRRVGPRPAVHGAARGVRADRRRRRSCGRRTAPASTASTARSRSSTTSARCRAPTGFTVSCLPVKVAGASAGWCRAAAIVE